MKDSKIFRGVYDRRDFIKYSAMLTASLMTPSLNFGKTDKWSNVLPTRKLGKTNIDATLFTMGTGSSGVDYDKAKTVIDVAIENGCRFIDTARAYGRGEREKQLGPILEPYRKEIILLSKTYAQNTEELNKDLESSLEALKTDYLDIYLLHAIKSAEDVDNRLNGGVLEAMLEAREKGLIKHIGFSGHYDPVANNYFLNKNLPEIEVMMCPVNPVDPLRESFVVNVLPNAVEKNVGVIGMKIFGGGGLTGQPIRWGGKRGEEREPVIPELLSIKDALYYAWSLPVGTTTLGCSSVEEVKVDIAHLHEFAGMSESKRKSLTENLKDIAERNNLEHYKMPKKS
ncbi:MAG: aldo/keto reductase [Melioribacteraceae bacterium]|nr:aldo/keto reductase [Melioribacteraceae bacterium]